MLMFTGTPAGSVGLSYINSKDLRGKFVTSTTKVFVISPPGQKRVMPQRAAAPRGTKRKKIQETSFTKKQEISFT